MVSKPQWRWWTAVLVGGLAVAQPILAEGRGVHDPAQYFSVSGCDEANRQIDDLWLRTQKDLRIEVLPQLPPEQVPLHKKASKHWIHERQFWRKFATDQAQQANLDGVYMLLCRKPPWHVIVVWPEKNNVIFPNGDQSSLDKLIGQLQPRTTTEARDRWLQDAVNQAATTLEANVREQSALPVPDAFHWTAVLWVIAGLLVLWLVFHLIRARVVRRQGGVPGTFPLAAGLPGAAYGAAAGLSLYQLVLVRTKEEAPCLPPPEVPSPHDADAVPGRAASPAEAEPSPVEEQVDNLIPEPDRTDF